MPIKANFRDYLALSEKQQRYVELKQETQQTDKKLAQEIGVDVTTISRWKSKSDFIEGQEAFQREHLRSAVPKAIQTLMDLLHSEHDRVRLDTAKEILNKTGYKDNEIEQNITIDETPQVNFEQISTEELREIVGQYKEAKDI